MEVLFQHVFEKEVHRIYTEQQELAAARDEEVRLLIGRFLLFVAETFLIATTYKKWQVEC